MKVLILSCNTGGGHNAAGGALAQCLRERGHEAEQVDFLALAGERVSQLVSGAYVEMVKRLPALFGVTYGLGRAVSTAEHVLKLHSPVYAACAQVVPALERYLKAHPCGAVVAPHMFPAMALTEMKRRGMALPLTAAVATDYTCIPFFEEADCDYVLLPGPMCVGEFERRGIPAEKLVPIGIPVAEEFRQRVGKTEARRLLGLEEDRRWVLVMGGSMGAGQIAQLTRSLLYLMERDVGFVVVCGSNERLYQKMVRNYGGNERVRVLGFTDQVARYMEASDLLYTKPGGITTTEGAVMGVPMVHMRPIPGCESRNRELFTREGMSVSARGVLALAVKGRRLLGSSERREAMRQAQRRQVATDAAAQIAGFLEEHVEVGR